MRWPAAFLGTYLGAAMSVADRQWLAWAWRTWCITVTVVAPVGALIEAVRIWRERRP